MYHCLCNFFYDTFYLFYKSKEIAKPDDKVFIIYDGDIKNLDIKQNKRKTKSSLKDREDYVKCWDYKNNKFLETDFTIIDLFKHYSERYKLLEKMKRSVRLECEGVYVVLSDIAQSTFLWNKDRFKMARCIFEHDKICSTLIKQYNGIQVRNEGDSFLIAFKDKEDSISFANRFFTEVSNIVYSKKEKIKVKVVVNYELIDTRTFKGLFYARMEDTYKISRHTKTNKICLTDRVISNDDNKLYCIHKCK